MYKNKNNYSSVYINFCTVFVIKLKEKLTAENKIKYRVKILGYFNIVRAVRLLNSVVCVYQCY